MRKSGQGIGFGRSRIVDPRVLLRHVKFEMFVRYPSRINGQVGDCIGDSGSVERCGPEMHI